MTQQTQSSKIHGLSGIRTIAIAGVVLYHLFPDVLPGGFLGVNLFFVLSGYLIAVTNLRKAETGTFSTLRFYKKRILRIYPALILTVLISSFFAWIFSPASLGGARKEVFSVLTGWDNIYQIQKNASYFARMSDRSLLTHLWSIAIELQFYLICPLLLLPSGRGKQSRKRTIAVLLILALISALLEAVLWSETSDPTPIYYGTPTRCYALFLGAAAGLSQPERRPARRRREAAPAFISALCFISALFLLLWLFFTADGTSALTYRLYLPLSAILGLVLILTCENAHSAAARVLSIPLLERPGNVSYEIYLMMYPVIVLTGAATSTSPLKKIAAILLIGILTAFLHNVCRTLRMLSERNSEHTRRMKRIEKSEAWKLTNRLEY